MKKTHNPDESVRKEQFGAEESASETSALPNEETGASELPETNDSVDNEESTETISEDSGKAPVSAQITDEQEKDEELTTEDVTNEESETVTIAEGSEESVSDTKAEAEIETVAEGEEVPDVEVEVVTFEVAAETEDMYKDITLPQVDYSSFSKHDLTETLGLIVENRPVNEIRDDVERIRIHFYKKHKAEVDEQKEKFVAAGGNVEEFKPSFDEHEKKIREHLEKYREKRSDQNRVQEAEKQENLRKKYVIIEKIKDLVNREESINKTFQEFRNLQNDWHSTGVVPQSALKDLWENYHHNVEIFYDYIKINKELRDLDLKKNLEAKIVLCEKTEELLMEPSAVNAFRILQEYQIGRAHV